MGAEYGLFTYMTATLTVSGANTASFYFPFPVRIIRTVAVVTTGVTVAPAILTGAIEQRDGTVTSPTGAAALTTMTIPVAAVNLGYYLDVVSRLILVPGERIDWTSDGGATAGAVDLSVLVEPMGFVNAQTRRATDPGYTDVLGYNLGYLTEVTA